MLLLEILVLTASLSALTKAGHEDLFNMNADKMFKAILGREPDRRKEKPHSIADTIKNHYEDILVKNNVTTDKNTNNQTTEGPDKLVLEDIKEWRRKHDVDYILRQNSTPIPDFENGADDPMLLWPIDNFANLTNLTRRGVVFGGIKKVSEFPWVKSMTIASMGYFMYSTRYKLPRTQTLRKKYHAHLQYRLGFIFGTIYNLKRQQSLMLDSMNYSIFKYKLRFRSLNTHFKLYEKVVRLDIDIKDIIKYGRQISRQYMLDVEPHYYDDYYDNNDEKVRTTTVSEGQDGEPKIILPERPSPRPRPTE